MSHANKGVPGIGSFGWFGEGGELSPFILVSEDFAGEGVGDSTVESSSSPIDFLGVPLDVSGRPRLRRLGRLEAILLIRLLFAVDALSVSPPPLDDERRLVDSPPPGDLVITASERFVWTRGADG